MVITTRVPAPAVSGRTSPTTVLAQPFSHLTRRSVAMSRDDRERHHRRRREHIEQERRSARAELALLYLGVRR
ncbi:hypothetical protein [Williamsia serinedens]|uniref:Uncharacterized protein n=1 Tax=Williamsia serinedens TaxID=391736 RepID=A0ABT1H118_9NOCA|nr:hypothetical protein [Williamsia serinedens]MCP2160940.1 hypothetical protein [Williamsia serinedens]